MGETSTFFLAGGEQTAGTFTLIDEQAKRERPSRFTCIGMTSRTS